jgi:hypothetical protein
MGTHCNFAEESESGVTEADKFGMWQFDRQSTDYSRLLASSSDADRGFENMDLLDRFFGLWRWPATSGFVKTYPVEVRRVDIVVVPVESWNFSLLGWTGSRQYNRFLRDYARRVRGLSLTSHCAITVKGKVDFMVQPPSTSAEGDEFTLDVQLGYGRLARFQYHVQQRLPAEQLAGGKNANSSKLQLCAVHAATVPVGVGFGGRVDILSSEGELFRLLGVNPIRVDERHA